MISGIDIICGIALLVLAFLGLRAGFLSAFLSIAWLYFTIYFASSAAAFVAGGVGSGQKVLYAALFLLLLSVISFIGEFIIWALKKMISVRLMGILDSVLAAALGGYKALLIMGVIFSLILSFPLSKERMEFFNKSYFKKASLYIYQKSYPFAKAAIPKIVGLFKEEKEDFSSVVSSEVVSKAVEFVSKEVKSLVKELAP